MSIQAAGRVDPQSDERRLGRRFLGLLRAAAVIALGAGTAGSVGSVLYAAQRVGAPRVLMILFAGWVMSPFVILAVGHVVSQRWSALTQATLHGVTSVVTAASLATYGAAAFGASKPKTAVFVIVAPASLLFVAIFIAAAAFLSRRSSSRGTSA